jgi:hypothetical protein
VDNILTLESLVGTVRITSLNVFDDGVVLLRSIFWSLSITSMFSATTFRGMALPLSSGEPSLVGPVNLAIVHR